MVRSIWKRALVTSVAWTSLAWAQQPMPSSGPAAKPVQTTGQYFTVQEPGKAGQKCKVLKTWKTPEGKTAYQVQTVDTGEMMTIVETGVGTTSPSSGNGPQVQAVATRIFHWGSDRTPPAGTPMPPAEYVQSVPITTPRSEPARPASVAPAQPMHVQTLPQSGATRFPVVTETEPARPGLLSRLFPWAAESRTEETIVSPAPMIRQGNAVQSTVTTAGPTSTSSVMTDQHVQQPVQKALPQTSSMGSNAIYQPKSGTPDNRFSSTSMTQPKTGAQDSWMSQSKVIGQTQSTNIPDKPPNTSEPRTTALPQKTVSAPAPVTQQGAAAQNRITTPPASTTNSSMTDQRAQQLPSTSLPQVYNTGSSSVYQPKMVAPDNRLSSPPTGSPSRTASQDTWMTTPKVNSQDKPSTGPDKLSSVPTPRATVSNPSTASPAAPQSTLPSQRLVQVVPPGNSSTSPATTTTPATPAISGSNSSLLNRQAVPATTASNAVIPPAGDKKPADATMNSRGQPAKPLSSVTPTPTVNTPSPAKAPPALSSSTWPPPAAQTPAPTTYKPLVAGSPSTPSAAPTQGNTSGPKGPVMSTQATSSVPSFSDRTGSAMVPAKRVDDTKPAPTTMAPSTGSTANKPAPAVAAPPSDWRTSWGKPEDVKIPTTAMPAQTPADSKPGPVLSPLPQADKKRPDPLQMPQQFDRRLPEEKPSAQKGDAMVVPAVASASTPAGKPPATMASEPARVYTPPTSTTVPLGAQSVIQAGDPGPGGVRYLPVPMVTIPDVRRAPVPPMTSPAQTYGVPGAGQAGGDDGVSNAFTPTPGRQAFTQARNAFGPMTPTVVPSSGQPMPAPGPASMLAQAAHQAGGNSAMNSTVVTAGYQGSALPNQVVPAGYHTMTHQGQPIGTPLSAVKPTPENVHQMVVALHDSLYPSQREWAAENMAAVDWRTNPQVVQALTTAAKEDPAATVRASCVRCLAKMQVNTPPVITVVRGLKNDADPRVRQEADRAMSVLAAGEK